MEIFKKIYYTIFFYFSTGALELIGQGGAREEGLENYIHLDGLVRMFPYIIYAIGISAVLIKFIDKKRIKLSINPYLGLMIFYAFMSIAWSDYWLKSLYAISSLLLFAFIIVAFNVHKSLDNEFDFIYNISIILALLSYMAILLLPSYGISVGKNHSGKWQGIFSHKNSLGVFSLFFVWLAINKFQAKPNIIVFINILSGAVLCVGSQSYSATIGLVFLILFWMLFKFKVFTLFLYRYRLILFSVVLFFSFGLVFFSIYYTNFSFGDKDGSFSGRNFIWMWVFSRVMENPVVGFGFGSIKSLTFLNPFYFYNSVGFLVGTAHNGFLEVVSDVGLLGLFIFLFYLFQLIYKSSFDNYFKIFSLIIVFSIINAFESKGLGVNVFMMAMLILGKHSTTSLSCRISFGRN